MNIVDSLVRRYTGFESIRDYDIALSRLKCYHYDVHHGITSGSDEQDRPVFACRFSNSPGYNNILALANEDGKVALQDSNIKQEGSPALDGTQCHFNAIFDLAWMPGEMKLVTASGDHTAMLWDVTTEIKQIDCYKAHVRSIKTVVFRPEDKAVFATGARDGAIMLWDIRAKHNKPDNCISLAHSIGNGNEKKSRRIPVSRASSITALAFQDGNTLFSCAAGDGFIKAWDLRKNYTVHKKEPLAKYTLNYAGNSGIKGFTSLLICPAAITLYASCMDNSIYAYNISSYNSKPIAEYYGHENNSFYIKSCLSPDGKYLASGSGDNDAYIWKTSKPGAPLVKLCGHTEEVTCIEWCNSAETKIVTCSDDSFHRIWRVGLEHKAENDEITIRGQAVFVNSSSCTRQLRLETTPTVSRRRTRLDHTPGSDTTSGTTSGSESLPAKRTRSQMLAGGPWTDGKFKSILSPIEENLEPSAKRAHMENRGARRLFSPMNNIRELINRDYDSDEPGPSSRQSSDERQTPFSPTLNLPNFVIDGTAPHLIQMSPQKSKENVDWLTKIRKIRYERRVESTDSDKVTSPARVQVTPARRNSRSRSSEPRRVKSPAVSLLNFFKKGSSTEKDCEREKNSKNRDNNSPQRDAGQ